MYAYVYAILRYSDGMIKVGRSKNVGVRFSSVIRGGKRAGTIIHVVDGGLIPTTVENHAHHLLRNAHIGGEWFAVTEKQATIALNVAALYCDCLYRLWLDGICSLPRKFGGSVNQWKAPK